MIARDQNGLEFEVFVAPDGRLRGPHNDQYVRHPVLDDDEAVAWIDPAEPSDVVFTERCECEDAPVPGVLFPMNGCEVQRCDLCKRFVDDQSAGNALAARLGSPHGARLVADGATLLYRGRRALGFTDVPRLERALRAGRVSRALSTVAHSPSPGGAELREIRLSASLHRRGGRSPKARAPLRR